MFLAARNAPDAVRDRLEHWVAKAWPTADRWHHRDLSLWSAAGGDASRPHLFIDGNLAVAVDGFVWGPTLPTRLADTVNVPGDDGRGKDSRGRDSRGDNPPHLLGNLGQQLIEPTGWPLPAPWDGSFAALAFDLPSGKASLALDGVGLRRVFHVRRGDIWLAGCLEAPLAYALGLQTDPLILAESLAEFTARGRRGLFVGIEELFPGERIRLGERSTSSSNVHRDSHLPWNDAEPPHPRENVHMAAEDLAPRLRSQAARLAGPHVGVALSSGLDSRLVLGALGPTAGQCRTYTYGHPDEIEMVLAARCAGAVGSSHTRVDLVGRYFPSPDRIRTEAINCASAAYPFWPAMGEAALDDGISTLLLGDITNCLQVRAEALWSRRARVRRRLPWIGARGNPSGAAAGPWLESEIERVATSAAGLSRAIGLEVDLARLDKDLRASVAEGMDQLASYLGLDASSDLILAQERCYMALERKRGGTQARALAGRVELIPAFATPGVVGPALRWSPQLRSGRQLLQEVAARLLSTPLARVPTATIPWASPLAPLWWQDSLWLGRFIADQALGAASRRFSGMLPRESLAPGFPLRPEHRRAFEGPWGQPWASSGCFHSDFYRGRFERAAEGRRPALVPIAELHAANLDAQVAAGLHGPDPGRWPAPA